MKKGLVFRRRYMSVKNIKSVTFLALVALIVCLIYFIILVAEFTSDMG